MNNKGFSLIEILAVVTILGILTSVGIASYSRYTEKAVRQSYETMVESTAAAVENYLLDGNEVNTVDIKTLVDNNYMKPLIDPRDKSRTCDGTVTITKKEANNNKSLGTIDYIIRINCLNTTICKESPINEQNSKWKDC